MVDQNANTDTSQRGDGSASAESDVQSKPTTRTKGASRGKSEPGQGDLDSVRMYLSGIGCVDLLSREEEVEIAKRIEAARNAVLDGVLGTQAGIAKVVELPKVVRKGLKSLRQVLDGSSNAASLARSY